MRSRIRCTRWDLPHLERGGYLGDRLGRSVIARTTQVRFTYRRVGNFPDGTAAHGGTDGEIYSWGCILPTASPSLSHSCSDDGQLTIKPQPVPEDAVPTSARSNYDPLQ